jgi:uncharacterized protein YvpB
MLVNLVKKQGLISDEDLENCIPVNIPDGHLWSSSEVQYMVNTGIMQKYADGAFKPGYYLTRESLAYLMYNYLNHFQILKLDQTKDCPFTDISCSYAKTQIIQMFQAGVFNGYPDNRFKPTDNVTRADMATVLLKISGFEPIATEITLPTYNVISVPYISQVSPVYAPVGCEGTSLLMGLHAKGYALNVGLKQFLDDLPKTKSDPAKGFVGSPYVADKTKKTRTTIYPHILTSWASKYGNVADFSGSTPQEIRAELLAGNTVVIYATLWWEKPFYRTYNIEGTNKELLSNNHVVLASGYDQSTNRYLINDPYNVKDTKHKYEYWIDGYTFEKIYNERRHAVVVQ